MEMLAKAIELAAKLREKSYNPLAEGNYTITIQQAADIAAEALGFDMSATQPIQLLLTNSWGDTLDWAKKTIEDYNTPNTDLTKPDGTKEIDQNDIDCPSCGLIGCPHCLGDYPFSKQ